MIPSEDKLKLLPIWKKLLNNNGLFSFAKEYPDIKNCETIKEMNIV